MGATAMVLARLFKKTPPPRAAAIPAGERVYAIGDIHGRDDLFAQLLAMIAADDAARGGARSSLILLGDLVDRGPASRAVVDRAIALRDQWGDRFHWLIGNHEEVFLKALRGDPDVVRYFVRIGGEPTILSYGIDPDIYRIMTFDELAEALPRIVPTAHAAFLDAGQDQVVIGDYLFVHAGIRPGIAIKAQQPSDLRWIRGEFLNDSSDHGQIVVHGHTITDQPAELSNRIGIDTGAYTTGKLTALGLEGEDRWFLTTA
jgi:serine/threonine protein phosphatase 1